MSMRALAVFAVVLPLAAACERTAPPPPVTTVGNAPDSAGGAIIVGRGDSLYTLSRRYNVPLRDLMDANRLTPPYTLEPGQRLVLPTSRQYIVQKGDTLTSISRMFNVEMTELSRLNGLAAPYAVHTGQPLRLPAGGSRITETADSGAAPAVAAAPAAKVSRGGVQVSDLPPPGGASAPPAPIPSGKPMGTPLAAPGAPSVVAPAAGAAAGAVSAAPPLPAAGEYLPGQAPRMLRPPGSKPSPAETAAVAPPPAATPAPAPTPQEVAVAAPAKPEVGTPPPRGSGRFLWPVKGKLLSGFGPKPDGLNNDGINIGAPKGTAVVAADNGVVAYAGNELRGFGNLLLVKHDGGWITAYAHLDSMLVERGAKVKRGEKIGTVGQSGSVNTPQLHFELRKGSHVVDPRDQMDGNPQLSEGASPAGRQGPG
ncbi:peptidoglycan DD-metalloendopeptidase family protein [Azospirillum sp.]|uniref:peptidoglycan DD-metalloendopeptidase family protein n=1 Tax=Azospirillum sp. TaxID=34012 RepID=UPI003D72DF72